MAEEELRPQHETLQARDKVVLKMTRDGAAEENLTQGSTERISHRPEDAVFQSEENASASEETPASQKPSQQQLYHSETSKVAAPQSSAPPPPSVSFGSVAAQSVVTQKLRKTQAIQGLDADETLEKAAETAASAPVFEEESSGKMRRLEKKAEKAHQRLDAAREKLPTHKVLKKDRVFDEQTGKAKTRLHFEDELKKPKSQSKLTFEAEKTVGKVGDSLAFAVHGKIHEVEQENSGVEAAHKTEIAAESVVRHYQHHTERSANKPFEKVSKLEQKAEAADRKLHFEKTVAENPEMKTSRANMNKHYQKQHIKKEYAAARKAGAQTASTATKSTAKTVREKASDKVKDIIAKNKKVFAWLGAGLMILILLSAGISSCTAMFTSTTSSVIATSYLSEDDAMTGAEAQYCQMEAELQSYLDNYESTHDYDEYHFDLDTIEHDPYVLISILSSFNEGEFTLDEVQGLLQTLFDRQYILTEDVEVEVRYRTETRTGTTTVTDPETGETSTETYTYEVEVPYNYYICTVTLENFDLSHLPVYIMNEDQLSMYSAYMSTLGNREDLFPGSGYVDKYIENPPDDYTVNAAYLTDEKFATLIAEAEKYLGYPYVWGGSNPSTSFDCSGFVSYVLTNSGLVNTGRLGAQGLYNVCSPVSSADVKPGDLVFFVGTYDTPGVSHVGIYVGDNVMLHCGDPIQYTSINTSYWQSHFYAFGRPNY